MLLRTSCKLALWPLAHLLGLQAAEDLELGPPRPPIGMCLLSSVTAAVILMCLRQKGEPGQGHLLQFTCKLAGCSCAQ